MSGGSKDPGGNRGASMGGLDVSPKRRKRDAKKRKLEEEQWAAKSGPVRVYCDPSVVRSKPDQDSQ